MSGLNLCICRTKGLPWWLQLWWKLLSCVRFFATPWTIHSPWNSPGQNTGVGSLSFLQGIFPTQESNPGLLHCIAGGFLPAEPQRKPDKQSTYITYTWNLRHDTNDQKKNRLTDTENKLVVNKDERDGVGRDDLGVWVNIYTIYKRDNQDRPTV